MALFILIYVIYFVYKNVEAVHMLQQNLYNENNRYLKWISKHLKRVYSLYDFLPLLFVPFIILIKEKTCMDIVLVASMIVYLYAIYDEYRKNKQNQNKLPLNVTSRIKRLFLTILIIYTVPIVFIFTLNSYIYIGIMLIILILMLSFSYYVVFLCSIINEPINKLEYLYYFNKARKKLDSMTNLKVIGITGSYGKTSSKNAISTVLGDKYITRPTPKNFNTPYGLMLTINNHLDKFDEILVAEMGAYVPGKIKKLCDFVHPKYGVLTIIGDAHLETFKTKENIQKTKFELIESLPSDGLAILNRDDPYQVDYLLKNKVKTIWVGIDNTDADIIATNIKCDAKGMNFDVVYKNQKEHYQTRLLGKHNVYNILTAVALGLEFGFKLNEMKNSILSLKQVEHRLELKKVGNIYQLDDAYNSNPVGARNALEVLSLMDGVKVVVTPGMIELGVIENKMNYDFGKDIALLSKADYVILIGKNKTKVIYDALIENNYDKERIHILNNVIEAYKLIEALRESDREIYALFENDLPDIYTEGVKNEN